ncbi:phage minor head protein [Streptomyces albidoflavus]|uniref:phage minor head protein n=1 Tax=Streptomyces albidoflavus TaxID=1886 RepID=UPI00352E1695
MDDDAANKAMEAAEETVARTVGEILDEVADEFATAVEGATELVAARFSVGSIARMWTTRVPRIMRRLFGVAETAAQAAADDIGAPLDDTWTDLPTRYEDGRLPTGLGQYATTTEHLLRAVGDTLAETARRQLAAGLDAGEDVDQLRTRLRAAFRRDGAQLGTARQERTAATEATRAWNTATLEAGKALSGPDRPLVKQWRTRGDRRVRKAHDDADGQLQLLGEPFRVGGVDMAGPGDPTAPASLTVNCRCRLRVSRAPARRAAAAYESISASRGHVCGTQEEPSMSPSNHSLTAEEPPMPAPEATAAGMPTRAWSTPDDAALAFEDQQTGDGRLFTPGSLAWSGPGPWPLQYADEMLAGHEGAELAGAIESLDRDGDRITATGVLYLGQRAGAEAAMLLEEGAPLGVSVDLDDVDVQFIDRTMGQDDVALVASLPSASVMRLSDGGWAISAATSGEWTASADGALSRTRHTVQLITLPGGVVAASAVQAAFAGTGVLTAAAGDPDEPDAPVVGEQRSGDILLRITRARLRGATLVAMPAYDRARIVLAPSEEPVPDQAGPEYAAAASGPGPDHHRVVEYVRSSPTPVSARQAATALGLTITQTRSHLARAVKAGRLVRLAPGAYVGPSSITEGSEVTAALSGDTSLPVHTDRDAEWDGDAAASRVLDHATVEGEVDPAQLGAAFLYRSPDADPATLAAYRLGFADVIDGELRIIPAGVFAVAGVLQGARGGIDLPADETDALRDRVEDLYERLADTFDDPGLRAPWDTDTNDEEDEEMGELEASAWTAMRSADPMPAAWFREPTVEELPPGSGGVHYVDGRVYGWVAQAGEPHAGYPGKKLTIESLGDIDTTHFLRARFALDDGTLVKAGAFTMNVGHHRDGAECETDACQFDDTRTVAAVVTVGMNSRGMWFSGAAAPWLSEWDRAVFQACQPSYHMKQGRGRRWQLRAVLSVPVPGHSSPLLASAVAERSNLALAASASGLLNHTPDTAPDTGTAGHGHDLDGPSTDGRTSPDTGHDAGPASTDVSALVAALTNPAVLDQLAAALRDRETAREAEMRAEVERLTALVV